MNVEWRIVAFETPNYAAIGAALEARGIYAWCKDGRVRASAHFYNTEADIDAFHQAISKVARA